MAQDRDEIKRKFHEEYGAREVTVIPATEEYNTDIENRHERVGPYSRVSTMSGQQAESYETQRLHYIELIEKHPNWDMVDMYADEGISATSLKKRKDFIRLIDDCKAGKVSLIVTKTVTRFARNIVDCLSTVRELQRLDPPVGVLFEADNIFTLEQKSELHLGMLAMIAQSESETKSAAVKWAIRARFSKGMPRIVDLYGYTRYEKRKLVINEEQAQYVRLIYDQYIAGTPISHIVTLLKRKGVPSPSGLDTWSPTTISYILTNERYVGDVIMQKTYVEDVFSHRSVKNKGKLQQYSITDYHEGIIPREKWLLAQNRLLTRSWPEFLDTTHQFNVNGSTMHLIRPTIFT